MSGVAISFGKSRGYRKPDTHQRRKQLVVRNGHAVVRACVTRGYLEWIAGKVRTQDVADIAVASIRNGQIGADVKAHYENPDIQKLLFFRARQTAQAIEAELAEEIYS